MIIVSGGLKGGSGKSTIATNLSVMRGLAGYEVLLVDADSHDNANASDFSAVRDETLQGQKKYTAIKLNGKAVLTDTPALASKHDDVIIDVGGSDSISQRAALTIADIYLVPVFPSSFDVWTIQNVDRLITEVKTINTKLQVFCFLNRADSSGTHNQEAIEILKDYPEMTYLEPPIKNRKAFRNAATRGLGVVELRPKDMLAIDEIKALYQHVFKDEFNVKL
jgi:chromosome partitioning protein